MLCCARLYQVENKDAVADTSGLARVGHLKGNEPAIVAHDGI